MVGQVIRIIAGFYDVIIDQKIFRVRAAGKLRQQQSSPLVGDFVDFEPEGLITKIHERKNFLIRPKVANVDQAIIICSLKEPNYSSLLLNKLLAIIEFSNIKAIIIFTKSDLATINPIQEYLNQDYCAFSINNNDIETLEPIKHIFTNKLSVFIGQTGAGKSSTIANISGEYRHTQAISKALGRGKHTTRVVEMVSWQDAMLIDTPGFSSLDLPLSKIELAHSYHDFKRLSKICKFKNCLHHHERDCGVKQAMMQGEISSTRYYDYLKILQEIREEYE